MTYTKEHKVPLRTLERVEDFLATVQMLISITSRRNESRVLDFAERHLNRLLREHGVSVEVDQPRDGFVDIAFRGYSTGAMVHLIPDDLEGS